MIKELEGSLMMPRVDSPRQPHAVLVPGSWLANVVGLLACRLGFGYTRRHTRPVIGSGIMIYEA